MMLNLDDKLSFYVNRFNRDDEEVYKQDIDNAHALEWLRENVALFECPDKTLEEIYYFRWWVFRKHIKHTEDGYVLTEFLPPVSWAGKHNTIICAAGHHIAEARWLKHGAKIIEDYTLLWLEEKSNTYLYSSWLLYAIYEYCQLRDDFSFGIENLELMIRYYEKTAEMHQTASGLFWSIDGNDGMEYSISGTCETETGCTLQKGIRPTLNSYMAANAYAISMFAEKAGREHTAREYRQKYEKIRVLILEKLWDGDFFKAVHGGDVDHLPSVTELSEERNAKELIGYIPWCFPLVPEGYEGAFEELKESDGFRTKYGFAVAEQRHPKYLREIQNVYCRWDGCIWPFGTTQVLDAVINLLDHYHQQIISEEDFYSMLLNYAKSHHRRKEDGKVVCWIDEQISPFTGEWSIRSYLKSRGWPAEEGGYERGKDYNHSAFCDLVIRGLLGIRSVNGKVTVKPRIPESWEYFLLDNLWIGGNCYQILYDKDGRHYNQGTGLQIKRMN